MKREQRNPHRTDRNRGGRVRVAPGVFVRSDKYLVSYTDPDGIDRVKTLGWVKSDGHPAGITLTQAKAAREKLRVQTRDGELPAPTKLTFADVTDEFLNVFASLVDAGERSERTLEHYRQQYRSHLQRPLGRLPIQKLTASHVAHVLAQLRAAGKSSWTVSGVYRLLGVILNHALSRGMINETPLKRLSRTERPTPRNARKARVLTDEQIDQLLQHALRTYRPVIATAAFTGMRQSELLGLRWQDIDFEAGLISVRHQLSRASVNHPPRLKALKSDAGEREIYLLPRLDSVLRQHKQAQFARGFARPEDYLFTTETGTPLYYRNVASRGLDKAARHAGLNPLDKPKLTMHHLRHTYISRLIAGGLDVVEVQRQAGHARPSITLDKYAQQFRDAQQLRDNVRAKIEATGFGAQPTAARS